MTSEGKVIQNRSASCHLTMKCKSPLLRSLLLIVTAFSVVAISSCEDKELVKKNEELRQRVSELEKKVDLMQINAGENPGDQTAALKKANAELSRVLGELKELDNEKVTLEATRTKLEKELHAYQKKYRINP